ncbi:hypothetical protein ACHAWX_006176 [Stephanocyclus meneghinianus]
MDSAFANLRECMEKELEDIAKALKDQYEARVNDLQTQHKQNVDALENHAEQLLNRLKDFEDKMTRVKRQHEAETLKMQSRIEELEQESVTLTQQMEHARALVKKAESKTSEVLQNNKLLTNELNGWEEWCKGLTSSLKPNHDMDFCAHDHLNNRTLNDTPAGNEDDNIIRRPPSCNARKRAKSKSESATCGSQNTEEFYIQEILDSKTLFRVRWVGYGPDKDSWEPLKQVAHTGHIDRLVLKRRTMGLQEGMPGVGIFESKITKERFLVDLSQETFYLDSDESSGTELVDDYRKIKTGESILWFWEYMGCNVPCEVVSFTPIESEALRLKVKFAPSQFTFNNRVAHGFENVLNQVLQQNEQERANEIKDLCDKHASQEKNLTAQHMKQVAALEEEKKNWASQLKDKTRALADLSSRLETANQVTKDLTNQLKEQKSAWCEERSELTSKFDKLSESNSRNQQRIKDFLCKNRTWKEEKEKMHREMEKQKSEWKEKCDMLNVKLAKETEAKMKASGNLRAVLKSCKTRMQNMKRQYCESATSMANKSMHRENEMRAEHERREAEARTFYQQQNEQSYYNLKAYYENKISALSNNIIQRDTELHTMYKSQIQSLTEVNEHLENRLADMHETEPPSTLDPRCEPDETAQSAHGLFSSFAQTLFENEPQDDQKTEKPSKKRKRQPSKSSMPLKQDENQSVDEDNSDGDAAYL